MSKIFLSVLIPAYNEKQNFQRKVLDKLVKYFKDFKKTYEVIIIDDGSTDGSLQLLEKFCNKNKNFKILLTPTND